MSKISHSGVFRHRCVLLVILPNRVMLTPEETLLFDANAPYRIRAEWVSQSSQAATPPWREQVPW